MNQLSLHHERSPGVNQFTETVAMSSPEGQLCKVQVSLPVEKRDATLQLLRDRFGEPADLNHRYTIYKEKQGRGFSIRVEDPPDASSDSHVIATLGEYRRVSERLHAVTKQHIIASTVRGGAHAFVRMLGCDPSHTWIERGCQFTKESIAIRVFSILNCEEQEINPAFFAVVIEKIAPNTPATQIEAAGRAVESLFDELFEKTQAFNPPIRP
jgi:hypothetical protein